MSSAPQVRAHRDSLHKEPPSSSRLALASCPTMPRPGGVLDGKYQLRREIGRGGMGVVFEGEHLATGGRVAIKVLDHCAPIDRHDALERFRREACAAGHIQSRHVVQVFDMGTDARRGAPYIVMELLHGMSLEALLRRAGRVSPDVALAIAGQTCHALVRAHAAGIVHRDIKPANIFLAEADGGESVVKLLDFGVAKVKPSPTVFGSWAEITRAGQVLGSPLYMSPEQAMGLATLDHRTDVWSLGVVLYELLSGTPPHADAGPRSALLSMIRSRPAPPVQSAVPWVSAEVGAIVARALAIELGGRFQSAAAMLYAIRAAAPGGLAIRSSAIMTATSAVAPALDRAGATAPTLPALTE